MKQKLKKIAIWFFSILLLLLISAAAVSYIYKDKIIRFVTDELGSQINGEVQIEEIKLSFLADFPNISIQLHNVVALSTDSFNKKQFTVNSDTAMFAGRLALSFNPLDFFQEKYIVQEIIVRDARINVFLDTKSGHNWDFIKETNDTTTSTAFLELTKISLRNSDINYYDKSTEIEEHSRIHDSYITGRFTEYGFVFFVNTDMYHKSLIIDGDYYFTNVDIESSFEVETIANKFVIKSAEIKNEGFTLTAKGNVINSPTENNIDIAFTGKVSDILEFSHLLPSYVTQAFTEIDLQGIIDVSGNIKGISSARSNPSITATVDYKNGKVLLDKNEYTFSTRGTISSNDISKISHYSFYKSSLYIALDNNTYSGVLSVLNFENPTIELQGKLNIDFAELQKIIDFGDYNISGTSTGNIDFKGKISDLNFDNNSFFRKCKTILNCDLQDVNIEAPSDSPYNFGNLKGNIYIDNDFIKIDSLSGTLQKSNFTASGTVRNLISDLVIGNQKVTQEFIISIDDISADQFLDHYYSLPETESSSYYNTEVKFEAKHFTYDIYDFTNVSSLILSDNESIILKNTKLRTINGDYSGFTNVNFLPNGNTLCEGEAYISNASAKEIFKTFKNFDQAFLTEEQIDGTITSKVRFKILFDKDLNPIYPDMKISANFNISNGSINNFEPFIDMGKKLKVNEFNAVSFKKLENTITINNDTVYIPPMNIETNAFKIKMGGKHSLSNSFNYNLIIFMEKTLSNRFKKGNNMEDFGEIEQNQDGNLKIPLKIFGNADAYQIDYDFHTSIENVKEGINRQKSDWREILGKPAPDTTSQTKPKDNIQTEFQIEYD